MTNGSSSWAGTRRSRIRRRSLIATSAAALALTACGRRAGTKSSSNVNSPSPPRAGGTITLLDKNDPRDLDPTSAQLTLAQVGTWVYDCLLTFEVAPQIQYQGLTIKPRLADRWESLDQQTFTFHLRSGVKFANLPPVGGRELTSQDIKWSYEFLSRTGALAGKQLPPASQGPIIAGLDKVEAPDSSTVVIHFAQPFAPFPNYAASNWNPVVPHEIFDQDTTFAKQAVGSGPWQLDQAGSQRGTRWVYKRNPAYFVNARPYIDSVNVLTITDDAAANSAYQTRQVDLLDYVGLNYALAQQMKKAAPTDEYLEYEPMTGTFLYMNQAKPPLNDERVRRAIALSIDRDAFIQTIGHGTGKWALAGALPGVFTQEEIKQILTRDPAQAKQLVAAAGHPNGLDIECTFPGALYGADTVNSLQLLQSQLKVSGINLLLKNIDPAEDSSGRRAGNFEMAWAPGAGLYAGDADGRLYPPFYPGSANNFAKINDPALTILLDGQRREGDPAKRLDLIKQAVKRINTVPHALETIHVPQTVLWHSYLKNYAPCIAMLGRTLVNSWLDK